MTAVFPLIIGAMTVFYTGAFAAQTLARSGALMAKSRVGLLAAAADALLAMVLAHVLIPWSSVPAALWFLPVAIAAAGVAGGVLRWSALPDVAPGGNAKRQRVFGVIHVAVAVTIIVLVLLL